MYNYEAIYILCFEIYIWLTFDTITSLNPSCNVELHICANDKMFALMYPVHAADLHSLVKVGLVFFFLGVPQLVLSISCCYCSQCIKFHYRNLLYVINAHTCCKLVLTKINRCYSVHTCSCNGNVFFYKGKTTYSL